MEEREKNDYTEILSSRLKEARTSKGLTIEQLAEKIGVQRQTLNYVELNKKGRGLTITNLIKVADTLEVSLDYLLGRVEGKSDISNNDNIKEWNNNTLGSFDKFMDEIKNQQLSYDLNPYIFVAYVKNNVLKEVQDKIKNKINKQESLNQAEKQKLKFLLEYVYYLKGRKAENYDFLRFLINRQWKDNYDKIIQECEKLNDYSKNKQTEIDFDVILNFQKMLGEFEDHLSIKIDQNLNNAKLDMIDKIEKDNRYYYRILKYFEEVK